MASLSTPTRRLFGTLEWVLAAMALALLTEAIGYGVCILVGILPPSGTAWASLLLAAIVVGGAGGWVTARLVIGPIRAIAEEAASLRTDAAQMPDMHAQLAARQTQQRQLRHDIRGALSPALLTADRLLTSGEPGVKRSGEIVVRSVEKAIALLADPRPDPAPNPPADP